MAKITGYSSTTQGDTRTRTTYYSDGTILREQFPKDNVPLAAPVGTSVSKTGPMYQDGTFVDPGLRATQAQLLKLADAGELNVTRDEILSGSKTTSVTGTTPSGATQTSTYTSSSSNTSIPAKVTTTTYTSNIPEYTQEQKNRDAYLTTKLAIQNNLEFINDPETSAEDRAFFQQQLAEEQEELAYLSKQPGALGPTLTTQTQDNTSGQTTTSRPTVTSPTAQSPTYSDTGYGAYTPQTGGGNDYDDIDEASAAYDYSVQQQNDAAVESYRANTQASINQQLADRDAYATGVEGEYEYYANPADDPNQWYDDSLGEYVPRTDRPEDWEARDQNAFVYNDDLGEWVPREDMPDNWNYGTAPVVGEPQYDDFGCIIGVEEYDDTDGICVPIGQTSNYLGNPLPVQDFDDFYLDHSEELDIIAAKYGVDPTSEQARELWEQEYGGGISFAEENEGVITASQLRSIADERKLIKPINETDWRFRIRLSPYADYLYNSNNPGILTPLRNTDGVIFPYVPQITISNNARYASYDLTHSNYRGYFYSGSHVENIIVNAEFTAQDTAEANYLLAVLHFFKSATKMFYGQDKERGTPPPLLYMTGFGEYQFNEHPCALTVFQYTLPDNVDYIRTTNSTTTGDQYMSKNTSGGYSGNSSVLSRLVNAGLDYLFGSPQTLSPMSSGFSGITKVDGGNTYVPTRINLSLTFLPINTRDQISKEFSLQDFASGSLIKKGIW